MLQLVLALTLATTAQVSFPGDLKDSNTPERGSVPTEVFPSANLGMTRDALRTSLDPTEVIVDFEDDLSVSEINEILAYHPGLRLHPNSVYSRTHEHLYIIDLRTANMEEISQLPHVENIEANNILRAFDLPEPGTPQSAGQYTVRQFGHDLGSLTTNVAKAMIAPVGFLFPSSDAPNDPMWEKQWNMRMVKAPEAWKRATGRGVIVAVIDTGVAYEDYGRFKRLEDLAETNFVPGYDFVNDTDHADDDQSHGSHVAGTIAQSTNNGVGVSGLAFEATIMPIKVLNAYGSGTLADIADGIRFAVDNGAKVLNLSLGGGPESKILADAVRYAHDKGAVVVCAAGNTGQGKVEYPAAHPGAFAVSSVGPSGQLASYSSWGERLAIAAPGGDKQANGEEGGILQNTIEPGNVGKRDTYAYFNGTSMASPHTAAVAALIISSGVTDVNKVEQILKDSAMKSYDGIPTDNPVRYGAGILNASAAVEMAKGKTGGFKYFLTAILAYLAMIWKAIKKRPTLTRAIWAIIAIILSTIGIPFTSFGPLEMADTVVLGQSWHMTALWASSLPVLFAVFLFFGVKRARGVLVGLVVGWGAYLLLSSILMPTDILFIPGVAGSLDRLWLFLNAGLCFLLSWRMLKVEERPTT